MTFKIKGQKSKTKTKNCPANRRTGKILSNTFYRAVCIVALFLMAIIFVPSSDKTANAYTQADVDNLNTQIAQLQTQLDAKKKDAKTFSDEVAVYDGQINIVQLQINDTQAQIDAASSQITDINGKIAANEAKLKTEKADLNEQLVTIYENSNVTPIELIAGSNSFSDFVDKDEYLQTIQQKTQDTIDTIKGLEKELSDNKNNIQQKKNQIAALQQTQLNQRTELDSQRYAKQSLLSEANKEGGQFQNSIQVKQAQVTALKKLLATGGGVNKNNNSNTGNNNGGSTSNNTGGGISSVSTVQYFSQRDGRWAGVNINGTSDTIEFFGCKLTSLAMILWTKGYHIYPSAIATNSAYFPSWGIDSLSPSGASQASGYHIYTGGLSQAESWAAKGKPFIASGDILGIGFDHSVVITGEQNGQWIMDDPWQGYDHGTNLPFNQYSHVSIYGLDDFWFVD